MKNCKMVKLGEIFIRLTRKNIENNTNVLTISAKHGLVNQEEFFSKSIASDNKSNYFLLYKGDFAYNKSYSSGYPFGTIKVLTKYEKGIVSPLYICFSPSPENHCPEFYLQYFESGFMNKKIQAIAQEGARNHGLLNIGIDDFFNIPVPLPPIEIQQKIADILSTQDKLIELKQNLINQKKQQKKWLMQNLLTGKIRLKGFSGKWEKVKLGSYIVEYTEKTTVNNQYPVLTSSRKGIMLQKDYFSNHQVTTDNNIGYNIIPKGYITYRSRSDDGNFKFNENKIIEQGIISYFYPVFSFINNVSHYFMLELLNFEIYKKMYPLVEGTAQQVLSFKKLCNFNFFIPKIEEQTAIAEILSNQDKEIELLEKQLEQEKLKKKALMQLLLSDM